MQGREALGVVCAYAVWKVLLRSVTGSRPDARGWGLEVYVSAFVHQLATTIVGVSLCSAHASNLDAWLSASWSDGSSQRPERLFLIMQAAEMATDIVRDRSYPGLGTSYLAHHVATLAAAIAALHLVVPVGGVDKQT